MLERGRYYYYSYYKYQYKEGYNMRVGREEWSSISIHIYDDNKSNARSLIIYNNIHSLSISLYNSIYINYSPISSGVGLAAIQLAKQFEGTRVIATCGSQDKVDFLKDKMGVDVVINYKEEPKFDKKVLEATGGKGVDLIGDFVGSSYWNANIESLATGTSIHPSIHQYIIEIATDIYKYL